MADTFQFELVSPERLVVSETVEQVLLPGAEGYMGVLAGHAPTVTLLRPGILEVYRSDTAAPERIVVQGGFAEVTPTTLTVLAEEATAIGDIDRAALELRLHQAVEATHVSNDDKPEARARAEALVADLTNLLDTLR